MKGNTKPFARNTQTFTDTLRQAVSGVNNRRRWTMEDSESEMENPNLSSFLTQEKVL